MMARCIRAQLLLLDLNELTLFQDCDTNGEGLQDLRLHLFHLENAIYGDGLPMSQQEDNNTIRNSRLIFHRPVLEVFYPLNHECWHSRLTQNKSFSC